MSTEFDRRRWFEHAGKRSPTMREILPHRLTARRLWVQASHLKNWETLFHEVGVVPFEETITPEDQALYNLSWGTVEETPAEFYGRLFQAICDHIEARWLPNKVHILFHSSGWDSRVIGWALKALREKNGDGWLGDFVAFCFGPEAPEAQRILRYEGWSDDQILCTENPAEWLYPVLDMDTVGAWLNGAHSTIPVSRFSLVEMVRRLHLPKRHKLQSVTGYGSSSLIGTGTELRREDVQKISGFGTDYHFKGAGEGRLRKWAERHYGVATSIPLALPYEILPYLAHSVVKVAVESSVRKVYDIRPEWCAWLDAGLGAFRRVSTPWPDIPPKQLARMRNQYQASWYGQTCAANTAPPAEPGWNAGHSPLQLTAWWSHWTAASYIENLRKAGYDIR